MRGLCADAAMRAKPALWSAGRKDTHVPRQTVAAFMIVRGGHAWLGTGWQGCSTEETTWQRDPLMQLDPGAPAGVCAEGERGVFSRKFTRGTVVLDCNKWTADFGAIEQ